MNRDPVREACTRLRAVNVPVPDPPHLTGGPIWQLWCWRKRTYDERLAFIRQQASTSRKDSKGMPDDLHIGEDRGGCYVTLLDDDNNCLAINQDAHDTDRIWVTIDMADDMPAGTGAAVHLTLEQAHVLRAALDVVLGRQGESL